jgi:hypothetical protein
MEPTFRAGYHSGWFRSYFQILDYSRAAAVTKKKKFTKLTLGSPIASTRSRNIVEKTGRNFTEFDGRKD